MGSTSFYIGLGILIIANYIGNMIIDKTIEENAGKQQKKLHKAFSGVRTMGRIVPLLLVALAVVATNWLQFNVAYTMIFLASGMVTFMGYTAFSGHQILKKHNMLLIVIREHLIGSLIRIGCVVTFFSLI